MTVSRRGLAGAAALAIIPIAAVGLVLASRQAPPKASAAAAIEFRSADDRVISLADFRGRFVLLNIWATWCPPCVKEMPSLDRLQALKGGGAFEVVALSIDRQGLAVVQPFFKRIGVVNLAAYLDRDAASMSALGIAGLPTTLLIDPAGREIGRWAGGREWDHAASIAEIEELIAKAKRSAS